MNSGCFLYTHIRVSFQKLYWRQYEFQWWEWCWQHCGRWSFAIKNKHSFSCVDHVTIIQVYLVQDTHIHCWCCTNSSSPNLVTSSSAASSGGHLVKKVPNKSCTLPSMGFSSHSAATNHKKPIELRQLPKRPPVDIQFTNVAYSVSEGRKRGNVKMSKLLAGCVTLWYCLKASY